MTWDISTIVTVTGTASAAIGGLLTFFATKGIDGWIKARNQRMKEQEYDDKKEISSHEVLIARLSRDLDDVRSALIKVQQDHLDCVKKTGLLEGKCAALETLNAVNEKRLEKMDKDIESLRDWRHNIANEEHSDGFKKAVEKIVSTSGAQQIVKGE